MLPLAQAYYPDQDEGVCDGTTDYRAGSCGR